MKQGVMGSEQIRILSNPNDIQQLYLHLLQSAVSEISLILSSQNALERQYKIGIINLLKKAAKEKNVRVNLAIPRYQSLESANYSEDSAVESLHEIEELPLVSQNIIVREYLSSINQTSQFKSTILLVDRQSSLIIDVKDDSRDNFTDAVGFATYTNSESRIQSYNFIFDTIWIQAELYRKLELRTVELEKLNNMQSEFVNVAAHELRTPTQAIVGYSEMLEQSPERNKNYEEAIFRNAQRLHTLTTDILDVARIESQTFKLDKSIFDLNEEVENVINEVVGRPEWTSTRKNLQLFFQPKESHILYGDSQRIHQVICNLVNNALKFTEKGAITIDVEKNSQTDEFSVIVSDTGSGIQEDILPRIFMKFVSKSRRGTGLGLFISKSIIEAHGGSIGGYNNPAGGATFTFTIPHHDTINKD